jgi:hypothetical protein
MSHWDNNDRVETMKRGNREYAETRKLERRREEFLEGNWLGEFLLLQKHDGEQPIGTYPVPADKPRRSSPTHPTRPPPVLKRRVAAMIEDRQEACGVASSQHTYREFDDDPLPLLFSFRGGNRSRNLPYLSHWSACWVRQNVPSWRRGGVEASGAAAWWAPWSWGRTGGIPSVAKSRPCLVVHVLMNDSDPRRCHHHRCSCGI